MFVNASVDFAEALARDLGLEVTLPRVDQSLLRTSVRTNSALGVGLLVAGLVTSSKTLSVLGCLGLAGAAMVAGELASDRQP